MSVLSIFTGVVKSALGIPKFVGKGIHLSAVRMLTFGLGKLGVPTKLLRPITRSVIGRPLSSGELMSIAKLTEREALRKLTAGHSYASAFPRHDMFETVFRQDRDYLYRMRVSIFDPQTRKTSERWVSMYSNENQTKDSLYEIFRNNMLQAYGGDTVDVADWNVEEIWHNKGNKY